MSLSDPVCYPPPLPDYDPEDYQSVYETLFDAFSHTDQVLAFGACNFMVSNERLSDAECDAWDYLTDQVMAEGCETREAAIAYVQRLLNSIED